ncbi:MAG: hypothetical protein AAGC68_15195, partial [Verrucomicrobiota bacterium]
MSDRFQIGKLILLAILAGWSIAGSSLQANPSSGEELIPAALGIRTDSRGNSWDIEANGAIGRIGSAMVNSGLTLLIDGVKFESSSPLMSADGSEFVLPAVSPFGPERLEVERRVKIVEEAGFLQYTETISNPSADPVTVRLVLSTNFSGNYRTFVSDRGR